MQTLEDWLSLAAKATKPAERKRCLKAATAMASSCHDWRTVLRGAGAMASVPRARLAELSCRTLESAVAERQVWGFRDVAAARAGRLGDAQGARAALDAGVAAFLVPRADLVGMPELPHGYEWVLLGRGFSETLGDVTGLTRCLEAGRDAARARRDGCDLCEVAEAWGTLLDRETGVALLRETEGLSGDRAARPWSLANAWAALERPDDTRRVLDAALERATTVADSLDLARAWWCHGSPREALPALARAEALAATTAEWLSVADAAADGGLGEAAVRSALERAEALAIDARDKALVSTTYLTLLDDAEAASRVGPRGVRSEARSPTAGRLEGWETDGFALFDWLRAHLPPESLVNIASSDYGTDVPKHLAALRDICQTGLAPQHLAWVPREVLELTRWSDGEGTDHRARALCCVLLCMAAQDDPAPETSGIILVESCLALGPEVTRLAELFFAAWADSGAPGGVADEPHDGPEPALATLLLFLLRAASTPDDARLEALSDAIVAHPEYPPAALVEAIDSSIVAPRWRASFKQILVPLRATHPHVARLLLALGRG